MKAIAGLSKEQDRDPTSTGSTASLARSSAASPLQLALSGSETSDDERCCSRRRSGRLVMRLGRLLVTCGPRAGRCI
jgi:hypothetical protein